ncbi:MAG: heavy-metal-associated domain-containing protein [Pyrinomonadaceae bacterium]|jgi:Cu+-exporting ATPase|nr:heavy-metal-associated domain-containing protein [Pyrinomonadaceae bacterium]
MRDRNTIPFSVSHDGRRKIITSVVLAVAVIAGATGLALRARITANAATFATVATERVLVGIEGMHCTSCASGIKSMLKRTRGVVSAEVSFNQKEANVEFDPSATSREKIIEAITNMGYKAHVKG